MIDGEIIYRKPTEVEKLKSDNEELKRVAQKAVDALETISSWRIGAIAYDNDMSNPERTFCEDVELIEQFANTKLAICKESLNQF